MIQNKDTVAERTQIKQHMQIEKKHLKLRNIFIDLTTHMLQKTTSGGPTQNCVKRGGSSGYECNTFVRVSLRFESRSRKALEKLSLLRLAMLSTVFFSIEQETLPHSRYMIWQIFT